MEDITDADYMRGKGVCKDFEIKNVGKYHDWYLKCNRLLSTDVFRNFKKMFKIYQLDPPIFLSASGLTWQGNLKKDRNQIRIVKWNWYIINGWKRN